MPICRSPVEGIRRHILQQDALLDGDMQNQRFSGEEASRTNVKRGLLSFIKTR